MKNGAFNDGISNEVCFERTDVAAEMTAAAEGVTAASGVALIMAAAVAAGLRFVTSRKENDLTSYAKTPQLMPEEHSFLLIRRASVVNVRRSGLPCASVGEHRAASLAPT